MAFKHGLQETPPYLNLYIGDFPTYKPPFFLGISRLVTFHSPWWPPTRGVTVTILNHGLDRFLHRKVTHQPTLTHHNPMSLLFLFIFMFATPTIVLNFPFFQKSWKSGLSICRPAAFLYRAPVETAGTGAFGANAPRRSNFARGGSRHDSAQQRGSCN